METTTTRFHFDSQFCPRPVKPLPRPAPIEPTTHFGVCVGDLGGPVGSLSRAGDDGHDLAAVLGGDLEAAEAVGVGPLAALHEGGGAGSTAAHGDGEG